MAQKITPFLLFQNDLQEVVDFYTSTFKNSKVGNLSRMPDGQVMTGTFEIYGCEFMILKGGPDAKFTPAISFSVNCDTDEEINELWEKLSEGGMALMELDKYDFSERYGWCNDKYGVSWQLSLNKEYSQKIIPSFMFVNEQNGKAEEAMKLYTSMFKNSEIKFTQKYPEGVANAGTVQYGIFTLEGQEFVAMDSNLDHKFNFTEAISFFVDCEDQAEVDHFWNGFLESGGKESMCGWLSDKYGVSWQIIPKQLMECMSDPDQEKAGRAMQAMMTMRKIDVQKIKDAFEGK